MNPEVIRKNPSSAVNDHQSPCCSARKGGDDVQELDGFCHKSSSKRRR